MLTCVLSVLTILTILITLPWVRSSRQFYPVVSSSIECNKVCYRVQGCTKAIYPSLFRGSGCEIQLAPQSEGSHWRDDFQQKQVVHIRQDWLHPDYQLVTSKWSKLFDPITWKPIQFMNDKQKRLFGQSTHERQFLAEIARPTPKEQLWGEIQVVRDGTFKLPFDCGIASDVNDLTNPQAATHLFDKLMPLIVPDGWSFQHFTDGTLPKLVMALPIIKSDNVPILLETPKDKIIYEILEKLGISNIVWYTRGAVYSAKQLYFACHAPPLHPDLWQEARRLLVPDKPVTTNSIVVLKRTRSNSANGGKFVKNYGDVIQSMRNKYGNRVVEYDSAQHNLESTVLMFSTAEWIIGSHGGAMFNQLFAPNGTNVVEYMPIKRDGNLYLQHAGIMSYIFSNLLGQTHWRVSDESTDGNVNMMLDLPSILNDETTKWTKNI